MYIYAFCFLYTYDRNGTDNTLNTGSKIPGLDRVIPRKSAIPQLDNRPGLVSRLMLPQHMQAAVERGCVGRIITSTYQNFTDIESIQRFHDLSLKHSNFACHLDYDSFHDESYSIQF